MDSQAIQPPHNHQLVIDRFVAACQTDERVVAAFLGGSYARGAERVMSKRLYKLCEARLQ